MPLRRLENDVWATLKKLVHDCLTENDGASYCPFRVSGAALSMAGIPTFIGCAIAELVRTGHFDAMSYGGAFAAMMGGIGVLAGGVAIKARTDSHTEEH
jgi:formate hydrogenlyase subunit 3/multisubunit Na+/H+ antiporter MnhD subunit